MECESLFSCVFYLYLLDRAECHCAFRVLHLIILSSFLKPLPHEGEVVCWFHDEQVHYKWFQDMIDFLLDLLPPLLVYIRTHLLFIINNQPTFIIKHDQKPIAHRTTSPPRTASSTSPLHKAAPRLHACLVPQEYLQI